MTSMKEALLYVSLNMLIVVGVILASVYTTKEIEPTLWSWISPAT
jgi:hypothetical protein